MKDCERRLGPFDCCTIVEGDCLDVMRQLPDKCVDLIIADPPYGVGIADWDNWDPTKAVLWIDEMMRINRGSLYVFFTAKKHLSELLSLLPEDLHILAWCKNTGMLHKHAKEWEWHWEPCVYWRGDGAYNKPESIQARDWVITPTPWAEHDEICGTIHQAQKPKKLIAKYMLASSNRGATVFDPFMGSGTTAVVASMIGRHFFGCDANPEYVTAAQERLAMIGMIDRDRKVK